MVNTILLLLLSAILAVAGVYCLVRPSMVQTLIVRHYYRGWLKRVAGLFPGSQLLTSRFFVWELRLLGIACLGFAIVFAASLLQGR